MIQKIVKKKSLHTHNEIQDNLEYWLSRTPEERLAAVEFYRRQVHGDNYPQTMQRVVLIRKMK